MRGMMRSVHHCEDGEEVEAVEVLDHGELRLHPTDEALSAGNPAYRMRHSVQ